jgi:hypothetical protein
MGTSDLSLDKKPRKIQWQFKAAARLFHPKQYTLSHPSEKAISGQQD